MNIQIYFYKKNFDVQKTLRFLKERRIEPQLVDLNRHKPGRKELTLFASACGVKALVDINNPSVKEHPVAYTSDEAIIFDYLIERPDFLVTPLIRNGRQVMIGFQEQELKRWLNV